MMRVGGDVVFCGVTFGELLTIISGFVVSLLLASFVFTALACGMFMSLSPPKTILIIHYYNTAS